MQAKKLNAIAKKNKLVFQIGHLEQFNPAIIKLKSDSIQPQFIEVHRLCKYNPRANDVDVVLDLMIHDIDIVLSLVNQKIKRLSVSGEKILTKLTDIANVRIEFNNNIGTLKDAVTKLEPEYEKNSKLFHSKKEVEDLYQNISKYALMNGLSIINLKKSEAKPVNGSAQASSENNSEQNSTTENNNQGQQVLYYKIPVEYEIQGNFLSYLKFRRALSKSLKVINFDKEEINLLKQPQGQVLAKGTISIVGLPDEYK